MALYQVFAVTNNTTRNVLVPVFCAHVYSYGMDSLEVELAGANCLYLSNLGTYYQIALRLALLVYTHQQVHAKTRNPRLQQHWSFTF